MGVLGLQLILVIVLMIANGFFSSSEIAIVSARRGRLQQRLEAGDARAGIAMRLAEEPNRFLATIQVGISLIGTFTAAFGGDAFAEPLAAAVTPYVGPSAAHAAALVLVVLALTYVSLILGELVPKRLALQRAETIAMWAAPLMQQVSRIAAPVVWLLTVSTQAVLHLIGQGNAPQEPITEDDVLSLVREGTAGGTVEPAEQELIERVFAFTDRIVRSIMTPRTEILALPVDAPLIDTLDRIIASGHSRIPIYQGSIDTIVGILHVKDLLQHTLGFGTNSETPPSIANLMRPPVFLTEHQHIASALQELRHNRTHLAMVVDEYGQIDGLVTIEDMLEELTGDIADEYDKTVMMVTRRADGSYLIDGLLAFQDAVRLLRLPEALPEDDLPAFETIAGLILALSGHIPQVGEHLPWHGWDFEVIDMDGVRIDKVLAVPPTSTVTPQDTISLALDARLGTAEPEPDQSEKDRPSQSDT